MGGAEDQTTDLLIGRRPGLPPDLQLALQYVCEIVEMLHTMKADLVRTIACRCFTYYKLIDVTRKIKHANEVK